MITNRLLAVMKDLETVDSAFFHLEDLANSGVRVTAEDLLLVVRACGRLLDLDRAFATFAEFPAFGMVANEASYHELIVACLNCKDPKATAHVYEQMRGAGIKPSLKTVMVLVGALAHRDYVHIALDLVNGVSDEDLATFPLPLLSSLIYILAVKSHEVSTATEVYHRFLRLRPNFAIPDHLVELLGGDPRQDKD
jgi:pentatricopeptide repeat protein